MQSKRAGEPKIPFVHLQWGSIVNPVRFYALCICCCCYWVSKLCLTLCNPIEYSMSGSLVLHYLPEFAQTRVHWIGDAIQPSCPLLSPSPPAFNLSQDYIYIAIIKKPGSYPHLMCVYLQVKVYVHVSLYICFWLY